MSEEDIVKEIDLIESIITHPAGYDVDLFGYLYARPTDQGVWCAGTNREGSESAEERCFDTAREAAEHVVRLRHSLQFGLDYEKAAWEKLKAQENGN